MRVYLRRSSRGKFFLYQKVFHCVLLALLLTIASSSTQMGDNEREVASVRSLEDGGKVLDPQTSYVPAPANTAVLTAKNNNQRTGWTPYETSLTTNNVNERTFGKLVSYPLDGAMYAQPLFVPNLTINGRAYNVIYAATEHGSVYAFDADASAPVAPLWHTSFIDPAHGITPLAPSDVFDCGDIGPEISITGTPVIDETAGTLYVVVATKENGQYVQRLHALDITTGKERDHSPATIQGSVSGDGDGSEDGTINFDPLVANQRPALLLLDGVVYLSWASYCDKGFYHGWIMGYDARTLQQTAVYNDTPAGYQGGIWQSGGGLAADDQHSIYLETGNGTFNLDQDDGEDAGNTVLKLDTSLHVSDYFTPFNHMCLDPDDTDLGSAGVILLPSARRLIAVGKEGRVYVLDPDNLGKYSALDDACDNQDRIDVDQVAQELPPSTIKGGLYSTPAYWESAQGAYVYMSGSYDVVRAFAVHDGTLVQSSQTSTRFTFPGSNPTLSSNGEKADSAILWVVESKGILHAYAANNLSRELYNSAQQPQRDALSSYVKFSTPTVANGRVFVATKESLVIYGLLPAVRN